MGVDSAPSVNLSYSQYIITRPSHVEHWCTQYTFYIYRYIYTSSEHNILYIYYNMLFVYIYIYIVQRIDIVSGGHMARRRRVSVCRRRWHFPPYCSGSRPYSNLYAIYFYNNRRLARGAAVVVYVMIYVT